MKAGRKVRVLMLGWEYPPRFAGGLGKACRGLSSAMARKGSQVYFVLPTFPERVVAPHLEVVGARECLIEAGWNPDVIYEGEVAHAAAAAEAGLGGGPGSGFGLGSRSGILVAPGARSATPTAAGAPGEQFDEVTFIKSEARLFPYGAAPEGEIPERIRRMMERVNVSGEMGEAGRRLVGRISEQKARTIWIEKNRIQSPGEAPAPTPASSNRPGSGEIYGKNLWSEIEKFCFTVRHMAETHEVDIIHAHDWMTFPAAFEFQKMTGAPVFLHVHATEYDRSGESLNNEVFRIEREGFRRATHIFAVSRYTAGIIERLYGVHKRKISVCYNAPDEDEKGYISGAELPGTESAIGALAGKKPVRQPQIVFLGRLTFQKGPDHFLRAAQLVAQADPKAKFVFCGTGDMMDKLRAQAHRLGIENRVHFAGFVDPVGVDEILLRSKVLVMPSVSEPFGLVALEAIRCGIPVILSKQSGVREVLHRALQVDFWDHERLADQILAALRLPDLSRQLVEDGMEQIQQLSWDKSAEGVIQTYRKYLGSTYHQAIGGAHGH